MNRRGAVSKIKLIMSAISVAALISMVCTVCHAATYYVDSRLGRDSSSGLTPATPWKTVARVNSLSFYPGDIILFRRGGCWHEALEPHTSGSSRGSILFGSYGAGPLPILTNSVKVSGWAPDRGGFRWKRIWSAAEQAGTSHWTTNSLSEPRNYRLIVEGRFVSEKASTLRMKVAGHPSEETSIGAVSIGERADAGFDFRGSPSRLIFSGAAAFTVHPGESSFSDPLAFTLLPGEDYLVAFQMPAADKYYFVQLLAAGGGVFKKTNADETLETHATGYRSMGTIPLLQALEAKSPRTAMAHVFETAFLSTPTRLFNKRGLQSQRDTIDDLKFDGDWYYDYTAKKLYMYSSVPIHATDQIEVLGHLREGIRITDTGNLVFEELIVRRFLEAGIVSSGSHNLSFTNLDVSFNGSSGYSLENGSADVTIRGGAIHDNGWAADGDRNGIAIGGHGAGSNNIRISSVDIYRNSNPNIELSVTDQGQNAANVTVEYSQLHDGYEQGFKIDGGTSGVLLNRNLIYHNRKSGYYSNDNRFGDPAVRIFNCVIWENGGNEMTASTPNLFIASNGTILRNNIIGNSPGYEMQIPEGYAVDSDYNLWFHSGKFILLKDRPFVPPRLDPRLDIHSHVGDPQFVDARRANFRIKLGSPAIGRGLDLNNVYGLAAPPGTPPGVSWDLGAFEYTTGQAH